MKVLNPDIIMDKGIKGVVIKLGVSFSKFNLVDNETIEVGAASYLIERDQKILFKNNGVRMVLNFLVYLDL